MDKTYNNHWYSKLRNKTKILGIWDDNDFGVNDGKSDNPIKHQQKLRFLKYMGDTESDRYAKAMEDVNQGIEASY